MIIDLRVDARIADRDRPEASAPGGAQDEPDPLFRESIETALVEKLNEIPERGGGVFTDGIVFVFDAEILKPDEPRTVFDALPPDQAEAVVRYVMGASDRAGIAAVGGSTAEEHIQRILGVVEDERNRIVLGGAS